jgi:Na+:H+ antiporter
MEPQILFALNQAGGSHSDPVVPILLALVLLTLVAALGARLMAGIRQPPVLGELIVGMAIGNVGYWLGNPD